MSLPHRTDHERRVARGIGETERAVIVRLPDHRSATVVRRGAAHRCEKERGCHRQEESMAVGRIIIAAALAGVCAATPYVAAEPAVDPCSLREAADGMCEEAILLGWQDPAAATPASPSPPKKRHDSLKNGAIIGGAIGLALGLLGSGIADCPGDDPGGSCPWARAGGVVVSTAFWAGIGIGLDALVTDRTHAASAPRRPAGARIRAPAPPSLTMPLRW
jgi:hypothetical protein